jgi:hypothetical protein
MALVLDLGLQHVGLAWFRDVYERRRSSPLPTRKEQSQGPTVLVMRVRCANEAPGPRVS